MFHRGMKKATKAFWILVILAGAARCILSTLPDLFAPEGNHWLYAMNPSWGYFDHPPLAGMLVRMTTWGGVLHHEFFVRLSGLFFHLATALLLFHFASKSINRRAGWFAVLLYHLSFQFFFSAVFNIPDACLIFFWLLTIYALWRGFGPEQTGSRERLMVMVSGFPLGLALLSNYHGLFLPPSVFLFLIFDVKRRKWLWRPETYIALCTAFFLFSPTLLWNVEHHFVSFRFQGSRGILPYFTGLLSGEGASGLEFNLGGMLAFLGAQSGLLNPAVFACLLLGVVAFFRKRLALSSPLARLLLFASLPMILFFTVNAGGNKHYLHQWSGPGWFTLLFFGAAYLSSTGKGESLWHSGKLRVILGVTSGLYALIFGFILLRPVNLDEVVARFKGVSPPDNRPCVESLLGKADPTLDAIGGRELAEGFSRILARDRQRGVVGAKPFLLTRQWCIAGFCHFYLHQKTGLPLSCWGTLKRIRSLAFLQEWNVKAGQDAYYILSSRHYKNRFKPETVFGAAFRTYREADVIDVGYRGRILKRWYVYLCRDLQRLPDNPYHPPKLNWDQKLFLEINSGWKSGTMDVLLGHVKRLDQLWLVVPALLIAVVLLRRKEKTVVRDLCLTILSLLVVWFLIYRSKRIVSRPRPLRDLKPLIDAGDVTVHWMFQKLSKHSFPSGHAAFIFSAATALVLAHRRFWLLACTFFIAALFSLSRIYVGAHFPLDVVTGMALGIFSAGWTAEGGKWIIRVWSRRKKSLSRERKTG